MYVLYGIFEYGYGYGCEKSKLATFSEEIKAINYVDLSETKESKKSSSTKKKFYKWSLLSGFNGYEIEWEDEFEVPHDPSPAEG